MAALVILAHLPFLLRHAEWLWQRPHYQFFPLVLVGAIVLAYRRLQNARLAPPESERLACAGLVAAWLILAMAVFLSSPWLGSVAFMALIMALLYAVGGKEMCRQALPAWVFLWLVVPPPLDLDRVLMFRLQSLTTEWSSAVLDLFGVYHLRAGNVIEVDDRKMMVEQACSGINSLYSLLSFTLFLVLLTGRGWVRGTFLMAAAVFWVLCANVARVTGVVWLETRWGVNVATGWKHETFGMVLFLAAAGLLLSTDQLYSFLTRSVQPRTGETPPPQKAAPGQANTPWLRRFALVGLPAYALLILAWVAGRAGGGESVVAASPSVVLERESLPARLGSWERVDFTTISRDELSFYGENSKVWKYTHGRQSALVSVDYPFKTWHDLTWCYVGNGWQIDSQAKREDAAVPGGFLEVRTNQPIHRHGFLLFCEFDERGQPLAARPGGTEASLFRHQSTLQRIRAKLGLDQAPAIDPPGPLYQLQVFSEGYDPFTAEEEAALVELFVQANAMLRHSFFRQP